MNHLWKTPCLAKPMKIWLVRATRSLFLDGFQAWLLTTEVGLDALEGFSVEGKMCGRRMSPRGLAFRSHPVVAPALLGSLT